MVSSGRNEAETGNEPWQATARRPVFQLPGVKGARPSVGESPLIQTAAQRGVGEQLVSTGRAKGSPVDEGGSVPGTDSSIQQESGVPLDDVHLHLDTCSQCPSVNVHHAAVSYSRSKTVYVMSY